MNAGGVPHPPLWRVAEAGGGRSKPSRF